MATFDYNGMDIYYEKYGEGPALILLNGIMMSTASWKEFIEPFSKFNTLILVDFVDQGKSHHMTPEDSYTHEIQIELVRELYRHLELNEASICGISYGSEVALEFSARYPELVTRLVLCNSTAATGPWLKDIGDAWIMAEDDPDAYYLTTIPVIYSPRFYKEKNEWLNNRRKVLKGVFSNPVFMEAMKRLTNSSETYDIKNSLNKITMPTLVVSCHQDYLTPMEEQRYLVEKLPNAFLVEIPNCGHASMYEQPLIYASLVLGFVNNPKAEYPIS